VCPSPPPPVDLVEPGWRLLNPRPGDRGGVLNVRSQWLYRHPAGGKLASALPEAGPAGSDLALLRRQLLDGGSRSRVVLGYEDALLTTGVGHYHLARAVVQAANRWTRAEWLDADERLYGLLLVCTAVPADAAEDIRRLGADDRFVGVALGANALGRAFGHGAYLPIYEAAAELDLPIVIQAGADGVAAVGGMPTAGGLPATYGEYAALGQQTMMGHVGSMITQGLFDRFPNLRVLLVGGGASWVAAYLWRLDYWFKTNANEVPWLDRLPSEYFVEHVRLGTHALERPADAAALHTALGAVDGIERLLLYTSGYPAWDSEEPEEIAGRLPESWHERVFAGNALDFFRWPDVARARTPAAVEAGAA
jgi:predicted TIM-barrel fold metal-dependent hydrolase